MGGGGLTVGRVQIGAKLVTGNSATGRVFDYHHALGGHALPLVKRGTLYPENFSEFGDATHQFGRRSNWLKQGSWLIHGLWVSHSYPFRQATITSTR